MHFFKVRSKMLNVHNLLVSFQGEDLFAGVSFMLKAGDRVGLIGRNGAGKSTLLKILAQELSPDGGTLSTDKGVRVGFLKQDIDFQQGRTILEEAYQAFEPLLKLEDEIDELTHQMSVRTDYHSEEYQQIIEVLNDLTHRYNLLGGHLYKGETQKVLVGLGFSISDFQKKTETFSGGWRMRIELAKLLLQNNEILLLDEPTNHLDIESIIWLEQFLKNYSGAVVLVSHDKMFLDNTTNRTIEITGTKIYDYPKAYSQYLVYREEVVSQQLLAQKNQEKSIEQTQKLIEKFRAKATKASMAQSLIKKLDKIERIEVEQEPTATMSVRFPISEQPGKVVLEIQKVSKSYGEKQVLKDVELLVERGTKVAFVGQNGQGKTTLAKMIVAEIPFEGQIKHGHNVKIGYFAQNQAQYLNPEQTILDTMISAANDTNRSKVRDILGAFLFKGEQVEKKVKVLSGGERNRLALAKMLLLSFNVLVLDEPTNHLDIASKKVLKQALQNFEGTLLIVSHDRDFLQNLTDKVYEFKDGSVKEYLGDIDFYLEQRSAENFREIEREVPQKNNVKSVKPQNLSYQEQRQQKNLQNRINKLENIITELEHQIADLNTQMYENPEIATSDFIQKYQEKQQELEQKMAEWEALASL